MSFFDDASLAFLPSSGAGKDGKAYSIKPTTGDGDFTFSRGSNLAASRIGPTGLIEKGRENLVLQSNQFDTTWTTINSSVTSGQSGYDGSSDAWLLTALSTSNARVQQNKSFSGVHTYSVYAKSGTNDFLYIRSNGAITCGAYFDISNGTTSNSANLITESITSVGNGWYRCSITFNASSSTDVRAYVVDGFGSILVTSGSNIYIQDAQLEIGLAATDYIESGATKGKAGLLEDEPRFDYSGGASCPALLLEPQRMNIIESSEYFEDDYWANLGIHQFETNTTDTTSPTGDYSATKIVADTSTSSSHNVYGNVSLSSGTQYAVSIFAKAGEYDYLFIRGLGLGASGGARFNISTGVVEGVAGYDSATIEDYGNGWYRCIAVGTSTTTTAPYYHMSPTSDFTSFAGNNSDGIYIYGAQCEAGSYATSYIPNHSGGSVTRGGDNCSTSNNSLLEQTSATYFLELTPIEILSNNLIEVRGDGSTSNRIIFQTTSSGGIRVLVRAQGSSILDQNVSSAVSQNTKVKVALKYTPSNISFFVDGVKKIDTDVSVDFNPELNGLDLEGSATANDDALKQHQFLFFPEALSDADCITLTTL